VQTSAESSYTLEGPCLTLRPRCQVWCSQPGAGHVIEIQGGVCAATYKPFSRHESQSIGQRLVRGTPRLLETPKRRPCSPSTSQKALPFSVIDPRPRRPLIPTQMYIAHSYSVRLRGAYRRASLGVADIKKKERWLQMALYLLAVGRLGRLQAAFHFWSSMTAWLTPAAPGPTAILDFAFACADHIQRSTVKFAALAGRTQCAEPVCQWPATHPLSRNE
jgi:hypothetical protein